MSHRMTHCGCRWVDFGEMAARGMIQKFQLNRIFIWGCARSRIGGLLKLSIEIRVPKLTKTVRGSFCPNFTAL